MKVLRYRVEFEVPDDFPETEVSYELKSALEHLDDGEVRVKVTVEEV